MKTTTECHVVIYFVVVEYERVRTLYYDRFVLNRTKNVYTFIKRNWDY